MTEKDALVMMKTKLEENLKYSENPTQREINQRMIDELNKDIASYSSENMKTKIAAAIKGLEVTAKYATGDTKTKIESAIKGLKVTLKYQQ